MYIQNQTFKDEETLLEQLFDFSLGEATPEIVAVMSAINTAVLANEDFQKFKLSLNDEEEIMEVDEEERRLRLVEKLLEIYESFEVAKNQLFGINGAEKTLLYSIDLY